MKKVKTTNKITKVVNGQDSSNKPTTLDEVWGYDRLSEYGTLDVEKYKEEISNLNLADLHGHAIAKGVLPADSREKTIKRLLVAFDQYKSKVARKAAPASNVSKEKAEQIRKIMSNFK